MDAYSPHSNLGCSKRPPTNQNHDDREPQLTYDAYPVFRTQDHPQESVKLGTVTELANGNILGHFTYTPATVWGCEWHAVPGGEDPPPLLCENEGADGSDPIKDDPKLPPTHNAYAVNRSPGYPPEWVRLGSVTKLENGVRGRFTSAPTSAWGWKWLAVPVGEEPPPIAEPPPARRAQQSRPEPEKPIQTFEPLPGEEDEPQKSEAS